MPPPQAILCHLCNGKYFKHSFPIHLKQCETKWRKTHSRCDNCGNAVANHDWSDHRMHCKPKKNQTKRKSKNNAPLQVPKSVDLQMIPTLANSSKTIECEECETENAVWKCVQCEQSLCAMCEVDLHKKGARARHTRIPMNAKALRQENLSIITQHDCKDDELTVPTRDENTDHRSQCKFCQRRFNPERVEKHMRICSKSQKKKRTVYDGSKHRVEGTVFAEFMYNRSETPEKVKEWRKNSRRWKKESGQLREIAAITADLKEMKDEENEIDIKVPSKRPPVNTTSMLARKPRKKQNFPLKGSSLKMRQRPLSNRSNVSAKANTKDVKNAKNAKNMRISSRKDTVKTTNTNLNRYNRVNKQPKKPRVPKFNRRNSKTIKEKEDIRKSRSNSIKSTPNNVYRSSVSSSRRSSTSSTVSSKYANQKSKAIKTKTFQNEEKLNANPNFKTNKKKIIQKENNTKYQQPVIKRRKSSANSLARGIELGVNVHKIFDDKPKTMNDYVQRERLRRNSKSKQTSSKNIASNKMQKKQTKPKLQLKKEIKIVNKPIGGSRKPSNTRELSSKRAQYFESLLKQQE